MRSPRFEREGFQRAQGPLAGVQRAEPAGRSPQGAKLFSVSEAQGGEAELPVEGRTGKPQEGVPQCGKAAKKAAEHPRRPTGSFSLLRFSLVYAPRGLY